jgi:hypothetical protein
MPSPQDGKPPGPDEIDRGLREILEGVGGDSALREPSAAERAAAPARPRKPGRGARRGKWRGWYGRRRARKLNRPARGGGQSGGWRRLGLSQRRGPQRRGPQRRGPAGRGIRHRKLAVALRWAGILLLFAALLFGLHLLGFGPQ